MEARPLCPAVWVLPFAENFGEVADCPVGDSVGDLFEERKFFLLHEGDGLGQLRDGGPFESVYAVEAVGGDAEVVGESFGADGSSAVGFLPFREMDGDGVPGVEVCAGFVCLCCCLCRAYGCGFILRFCLLPVPAVCLR